MFPNKTIFSISSMFGSPVTVSDVSNANPGVATAAAHGLSDGDLLLMSSGWGELNDRPVRVDGAATGTFELEGFDTTSVTRFPAGNGGGTVKEVTAWVALSQITDLTSSGGEQQYYQWVYLEDGKQRQRPTYKNARQMSITLDYDNALAWYTQLLESDLTGETYVLRAALPNGKFLYWSVTVGFDGEPSMVINQNMQVVATFSMVNPASTKY